MLITSTLPNVNVTLAAEDVTKVSAVVHGILSGIPVPFPLDNPDGCKDSGLTCPLKSGQPVNYKTSIFVRDSYPKVCKISSVLFLHLLVLLALNE